ncbi:hypothetical protein HY250_01670 [Candidatus Azambacteria bacterium]|nr:hypothetical protein [Candidatus Azambacteria bacterium]MBI3685089.1 hypothetical protein [Candidatus Azambacteria bacterium]
METIQRQNIIPLMKISVEWLRLLFLMKLYDFFKYLFLSEQDLEEIVVLVNESRASVKKHDYKTSLTKLKMVKYILKGGC